MRRGKWLVPLAVAVAGGLGIVGTTAWLAGQATDLDAEGHPTWLLGANACWWLAPPWRAGAVPRVAPRATVRTAALTWGTLGLVGPAGAPDDRGVLHVDDLAIAPDLAHHALEVTDRTGDPARLALDAGGRPLAVARCFYAEQGHRILVAALDQANAIALVDLTSREVVARARVGGTASAAVAIGDRAFVAVPRTGQVVVIDVAHRTQVGALPVGGHPGAIAVAPMGPGPASQLWVADAVAPRVSVLDASRLGWVAEVPVGPGPHRLAFSADGARAYVTNADGTTTVVDRALVPGGPVSADRRDAGRGADDGHEPSLVRLGGRTVSGTMHEPGSAP